MTTPVPEEAVRLAVAARARGLIDRPDPAVLSDEQLTREMLQAAAPVLAAAERARILGLGKGFNCPCGEDGCTLGRETLDAFLNLITEDSDA